MSFGTLYNVSKMSLECLLVGMSWECHVNLCNPKTITLRTLLGCVSEKQHLWTSSLPNDQKETREIGRSGGYTKLIKHARVHSFLGCNM